MKLIFPALCWAVLLGGFACAKKPKPVPTTPPAPAGVPFEEDLPMTDPDEVVLDLDPIQFGPVYFDFNSSTLKDAWKVQALAKYLTMTSRPVHLAGHASEEGTDDYNLHLGARRAQAVRDYLQALGVEPGRITWKSYGEEKPLAHDRVQFALNRRVEITLEDPK